MPCFKFEINKCIYTGKIWSEFDRMRPLQKGQFIGQDLKIVKSC